MSKKEAPEEVEAAEGETKTTVDRRYKKVTSPDGVEHSRTDYIRELWASGNYTRADIRNHIKDECTSEDGAHDIAYQIVFAATKGHEGGPSEAVIEKRKADKEAAKATAAAEKAAEKAAAKAPAETAETSDAS